MYKSPSKLNSLKNNEHIHKHTLWDHYLHSVIHIVEKTLKDVPTRSVQSNKKRKTLFCSISFLLTVKTVTKEENIPFAATILFGVAGGDKTSSPLCYNCFSGATFTNSTQGNVHQFCAFFSLNYA